MSCASKPTSPPPSLAPTAAREFQAVREDASVNGERAIALRMALRDPLRPQITSVEILPGRGMNIYQVRGHLPGKGEVDLFVAAPLRSGENSLGEAKDDDNGNLSFKTGGALLAPYANRIRGALAPDGKSLRTRIGGAEVALPANWSGKKPGAERNAMHGLILNSRISDAQLEATAEGARARGAFDAGDFGVGWPSKTSLAFDVAITAEAVEIALTAKNVGDADLPMGIGWHPYFALPSGRRAQARLRIPARTRLLVNNYDDVFPTGRREAIKGTPYDFAPAGGKALGDVYLDDCFVDLKRDAEGAAVAEIVDPASAYGMRVSGLSPEISAFQVYAPPEKSFVALEPQFNWADPYRTSVWKRGEKTGMATLKPGQSVTYKVRLQIFAPDAKPQP